MSTQHTPGQWVVGGSDTTTQIWVCAQRGLRICTLKPSEQDLSNARLIAAAPDLLAALQSIVDKYDDGAHEAVLAAVARAAIAKATA